MNIDKAMKLSSAATVVQTVCVGIGVILMFLGAGQAGYARVALYVVFAGAFLAFLASQWWEYRWAKAAWMAVSLTDRPRAQQHSAHRCRGLGLGLLVWVHLFAALTVATVLFKSYFIAVLVAVVGIVALVVVTYWSHRHRQKLLALLETARV